MLYGYFSNGEKTCCGGSGRNQLLTPLLLKFIVGLAALPLTICVTIAVCGTDASVLRNGLVGILTGLPSSLATLVIASMSICTTTRLAELFVREF